MNDVMVRIDHVTKEYRLGQIGGTTLRDELQRFSARLHHREDPTKRIGAGEYGANETFLALKDVSLDVKKGQRLGIIGKNGAGKSTLLKLISRVTVPTSGMIGLNGRVASMLEVGTGFHGELTGRENIYMNGAILGMTKREINDKMESIIDFSECRQFIDTPVKRYSSGMYVKLAFAVAAHLNSEILIMDEVLAVGDMAFQKKCLDKMNDVSRSEDRTILYVSHNMNTIRSLCDRCVVLDHGSLIFDGGVAEGISVYMDSAYTNAETKIDVSKQRRWGKEGTLVQAVFVELCEKEQPRYEHGEDIIIQLTMKCGHDAEELCIRIEVLSEEGIVVGTAMAENVMNLREGEQGICKMTMTTDRMIPGQYHTRMVIYQKNEHKASMNLDVIRDAFSFEIIDTENHMPIVWDRGKWGYIILPEMQVMDRRIT